VPNRGGARLAASRACLRRTGGRATQRGISCTAVNQQPGWASGRLAFARAEIRAHAWSGAAGAGRPRQCDAYRGETMQAVHVVADPAELSPLSFQLTPPGPSTAAGLARW